MSGSARTRSAMAMAVSGPLMAYHAAGKASRDAIFLSQFRTSDLAAMVMAGAIAAVVASIVGGRMLVRLGPHRIVPVAFTLSSVLQLAYWLLLGYSARSAACVIYLHWSRSGRC